MSDNCKEGEAPSSELESLKLGNGSAPTEEGAAETKTTDEKEQQSTPVAAGANKSGNGGSFREQFKAFSKFGDSKSDGKQITLSQSDKWMKQAKVIDGKKITTTDTGIYFKKFKSLKIGLDDYNRFLDELAKNKKVEVDEIKNKMSDCGQPGFHGVGAAKTPSAVERLTDVSKYTGSHKQRFDNSGKGKGIAGRKDIPDSSGYVSGYQNKDTYNKTH